MSQVPWLLTPNKFLSRLHFLEGSKRPKKHLHAKLRKEVEGVTDRGATPLKVLRGFQRFSEVLRIRFLIQKNGQESAEKCSDRSPLTSLPLYPSAKAFMSLVVKCLLLRQECPLPVIERSCLRSSGL